MKKCSKCGYEKILDDFGNNKSKKDGKATECKECKSKQDAKYRKENEVYYKNYLKEYNQLNKQQLYEQKKKYIAANKIAHLERQHSWYEKNKDNVKLRTSQYKKDHPEQYQMYNNRRAARKKTAIVEKFTHQDVINKYGDKCVYCGGNFDEIDHYIPLSKGGSHTLDNVRPSCEHCNLTKSNKLPEDFAKYKGNKDER
jgi:5-methylcytosine-specific restriction endonuclease McrA